MTGVHASRLAISNFAHAAGQIAALANVVSESLFGDPSTAIMGEAVAGLDAMARRLSDEMLELSEGIEP